MKSNLVSNPSDLHFTCIATVTNFLFLPFACCFKMQTKHAERETFPLDAYFSVAVFHFIDQQQIDRLTSCNKAFFDPSRPHNCAPLILLFNLTCNFHVAKIFSSNHRFQHISSLLVVFFFPSPRFTSPFFFLPSRFFLSFPLNVNSSVISHRSPLLCLSLSLSVSFLPFFSHINTALLLSLIT